VGGDGDGEGGREREGLLSPAGRRAGWRGRWLGGGAMQKNRRVRWRGEWSDGGRRLEHDQKNTQKVPKERGSIMHFVTGVS